MARSCLLSAAALALLLSPAACSSVGGSTGVAPATPLAATTVPEPQGGEATPVAAPPAISAPSAISSSPAISSPSVGIDGLPSEAQARRQPRAAAPLSVLNQMVTTQALLISLLLAPVSSGPDAASPPPPRH